MRIYHGSEHIIKNPELRLGKKNNDYGQGFYCTDDVELAKEWACKNNNHGYVNSYEFVTDGLRLLNLLDSQYSILSWLAILVENRTFALNTPIAIKAKQWLHANYFIDVKGYDYVIGYRADDSYFAFASLFLSNSLSLEGLCEAFYLGNLGNQIVLVSQEAFEAISYAGSLIANKMEYYKKYVGRDAKAREQFRCSLNGYEKDEIYINDLMKMSKDEVYGCLQRIISRRR